MDVDSFVRKGFEIITEEESPARRDCELANLTRQFLEEYDV